MQARTASAITREAVQRSAAGRQTEAHVKVAHGINGTTMSVVESTDQTCYEVVGSKVNSNSAVMSQSTIF